MLKLRRQERIKEAKKNKGKAFVPTHGDIKP